MSAAGDAHGNGNGAVPADAVDLLLGQHMRIRDLFVRVEAATGRDRREAFRELVHLLAVHETAEEEVVHPLVRSAVEGGDAIVDDRLAEEHAAKKMLSRLEDTDPDGPEFGPLLAGLRQAVLTHANAEETHEFRYLRRSVDAEQLRALVPVVRAAEAMAPTHPHPGVESAKANLVAGPVAAVFDRARDLVRRATPGDR
ncbi:MAG TPA: hemerythrin domain-containing protein [Pseudonocardiaceae bacterium]